MYIRLGSSLLQVQTSAI